jgi:hypothetical protein
MDSAVIARKLPWRERRLSGEDQLLDLPAGDGDVRLVCEECGRIEPYRDARL